MIALFVYLIMYALLKYWELIKKLLINGFKVFMVGKLLQYEVIFLSRIIVTPSG